MTNTLPTRTPKRQRHDTSSLKARITAAGLDDEPEHIDDFRNSFARIISMYINTWQGCPEPLCQRHRGCMAPQIRCTNAPHESDEERERNWPHVQAEVRKALDAALATAGVTDD